MHEMGIANSVIDAVRVEARKYPGSRPRKVGVRIGELTAIDASALQFCFEALVRETDLELLELAIEICPRRHRCLNCAADFDIKEYEFHCPQCGESHSECISGDELQLAYLEMDEYEPRTA
jgi:hydrogenase nickel incorporation protein HypA/HybF